MANWKKTTSIYAHTEQFKGNMVVEYPLKNEQGEE